jgi:hypothetical protein
MFARAKNIWFALETALNVVWPYASSSKGYSELEQITTRRNSICIENRGLTIRLIWNEGKFDEKQR